MKTQLVCHFGGVHRVRQVLLVGEAEQHRVAQLVLVQHAHQLVARLVDALPVVTVDHKDEPLGVLEIVPPEWSDLVLTTDIPYRETEEGFRFS